LSRQSVTERAKKGESDPLQNLGAHDQLHCYNVIDRSHLEGNMRLRTIADLGTAIRSARHARGWTQDQLAERAGVSRRWISEIEGGKSTAQIGKILVALEALDIELHDDATVQPDRPHEPRSIDLDLMLEELTGPPHE
jgi:HTH-type transcriptional regulator / antitoxin HipB